jgi:Lsr2
MAQKVNIILVDDIDGTEATETVRFGLDGTSYEIDLNAGHACDFRALMAPFTEKARKVTSPGTRPGRRTGAAGDSNKEIRDWAREQGLKVSDRGRIPADVIARHQAEKHGAGSSLS